MSHLAKKPKIAVDLDGTLAYYTTWLGPDHVGLPIKDPVDRVKRALAMGWDVWIFTARVAGAPHQDQDSILRATRAIQRWCLQHLGQLVPITAVKAPTFDEFWDDRAVGLHKNAGTPRAGGEWWDALATLPGVE